MDISNFTIEQLNIYTAGKVILSYGGCFCPPHAGHYNLLTTVIEQTRPDIVVIASTNNDEYPRHGVPLSFTLKTWKEWATLLQQKYGADTYVVDMYDDNIMMGKGASAKIKEYITIVVHEGPNNKSGKVPTDMSMKSLAFLANVPRDAKVDKVVFDYHINRTGDLSATAFVRCLMDGENCDKYVPEGVNKDQYINSIRRDYGPKLI